MQRCFIWRYIVGVDHKERGIVIFLNLVDFFLNWKIWQRLSWLDYENVFNMLSCLFFFSECLKLKNVTFIHCWIKSDLNIINSKLRHLKLINCGCKELYPGNIYIDALNLSSFEYRMGTFFVNAPRLLKVFWKVLKSEKNHY